MKPRAIISVYDKTGIVDFCKGLSDLGFELVASGGTAKMLIKSGLEVKQVSDITGFPEILDGRVKTLHPAVHGGLLARRSAEHLGELEAQGITPVDVLVCNLYPFEETLEKKDVTEDEMIEQIDIGGVAMLRAAAKNFESVTVVCQPGDYEWVLKKIQDGGSLSMRKTLAKKAFLHTASYDTIIAKWMLGDTSGALPGITSLVLYKTGDMRYGENPHQQAGLYCPMGVSEAFTLVRGKQLSYNNLVDTDATYAMVETLQEPAVAIVKHTNPCGLATADTTIKAFLWALECDPVSAFGSVIAVNRIVDLSFVQTLGKLFVEVIVAPSFEEDAVTWLAKNKKNCRVVVVKSSSGSMTVKSVRGNFLLQTSDIGLDNCEDWKVVTTRQPTERELESLSFAWHAVRHVKSNAIVFAKGTTIVGIGAGQMNRVDSVFLAARRAGEKARGAVMASDAFFPFPDGIKMAAQAGITACIQPGGSVKDADAIAAADLAGMTMIFTGVRHFKH